MPKKDMWPPGTRPPERAEQQPGPFPAGSPPPIAGAAPQAVPAQVMPNAQPAVAATAVPAAVPQSQPQPATQPAPQHATPASAQAALQRAMADLQKPVPKVEHNSAYALSLLFAAALMLFLLLVYIGLIGALVGLLAATVVSIAQGTTSTGLILADIVLIPVGLLAVVFMVKPLFARRGKAPPKSSLDPAREPALFAYIDHLCHALGAPTPKRIDVFVEPNASASFRHGLFSLVHPDDLVLTIGLSLSSGLTLRQLTGVLAHELGHFSQTSGMRLMMLTRYLTHWMERVVYERDALDEKLYVWSQSETPLAWIALAIRGCVWVTRKCLWLVMMAGYFVSTHMSRQAEFDADKYEIRIAGSRSLQVTELNLHALGFAMRLGVSDLQDSWMEKRLCDDLPTLVMAKVQHMQKHPSEVAQIRKAVLEAKTGIFDSHPCSSERIQAAEEQNETGVLTVDAPASILFSDYPALCKAATLAFYKHELELEINARNLVPTTELVAEQTETSEAFDTLDRYFQGRVIGAHQIFLPANAIHPPTDPQLSAEILKRSRQQMLSGLKQAENSLNRFKQADDRMRELAHAWVVLEAGFSFNPSAFNLPYAGHAAVNQAKAYAKHERDVSDGELEAAMDPTRNRMVAALQLLYLKKVADRIENAPDVIQRCKTILVTMSALERVWPMLLKLREVTIAMEFLVDILEAKGGSHQLVAKTLELSRDVGNTLNQIRFQLSTTLYPFRHAAGQIAIGNYALKEIPQENNVGEMYGAAFGMYEKLMSLYYRGMAALAVTAEKVEVQFGLEPLPEPVHEAEDPWAVAGL